MKSTAMSDEERLRQTRLIEAVLASPEGQRLRAIRGVVHACAGLKQSKGKLLDEFCIRVYVQTKKPISDLSPEEKIPETVGGYPTDVHTTATINFSDNLQRYSPLRGGIRITNGIIIETEDHHFGMRSGTLGCFATDNTDHAPVMLSNWHVLYGSGARDGNRVYHPGQAVPAPPPEAVLPYTPTTSEGNVAQLTRNTISRNPPIDAAIAKLDVSSCCGCCGVRYENRIEGIDAAGGLPRNTITGQMDVAVGMVVFKVGIATGLTKGRVVAVNVPPFSINRDGNSYTFSGTFQIDHFSGNTTRFSTHGDSGAVVLNDQNKIIGLLFSDSRSSDGGITPDNYSSYAHPIGDVITALNITIPFSPAASGTAGQPFGELVAPSKEFIHPAYETLYKKYSASSDGHQLLQLAETHSSELVQLVNHSRPVTVAWQRSKGPALLASLMGAIREGNMNAPLRTKDSSVAMLFEKMQDVLLKQGSVKLKNDLRLHGNQLIDAAKKCSTLDELMSYCDEQLILRQS